MPGGTRPSHGLLWADCISLLRAASAPGPQRGLSSKAGGAPGERLSGSGCTLLRDAVCFVIGLYISRFLFPLYISAKRPVCRSAAYLSSSALLLYLWSALPVKVLVEGWRGGGRSKLSSASYGISSIGDQAPQVQLWSVTLILEACPAVFSPCSSSRGMVAASCSCSSLDDLKIFYWLLHSSLS